MSANNPIYGVPLSINTRQYGQSGSGDVSTHGVFAGKTAAFFGDSLTEQNYHYTKGYHAWVKEILGLASYNNYGVSGYKVSDVYSKVNAVTANADIVFVMCGVNDQNFSVPLGYFGDTTADTTYGALNMLCSMLKQKYPTSVIVFITPHYQNKYPHSSGVTSYEVSKAIREVCGKYAIPVYDNFSLSGIYGTNLSTYTTDNCHWNDTAHEMVGKNLAHFVAENFHYVYGNTTGGDTHEHSYMGAVTTPATCTTAGVKTFTCGCGDSYTESIPAIGHDHVDGVCSVCGHNDVMLEIINDDSVSTAIYENQTLTLSMRDTFGGVLFAGVTEMKIDVSANSKLITPKYGIGWLCGYDSGVYHAMGVYTDNVLETYDFSGDPLAASNNNQETGVTWDAHEKITVRVENGNVNMYFDDSAEPAFSVVGTAIAYITSDVKALKIYGVTFTYGGAAYTITRNLSNVVGFDDSETIAEGGELLECYISDDECTMNGASATVTMGGEDITSTAWDNGVVNIPEVTGNVVINVNAVKIDYVVPPMEDFTLQLYENTKLLVKGYTGAAKAVELPAVFTYNGKEYPLVSGNTPTANSAVLYSFGLNTNVEHLKHPFAGFPGVSSSITPNFRTVDAGMNTSIFPVQNLTRLEKVPTASSDGGTFIAADNSSYKGCTSIRTVRNVVYPDAQTSLQWLYHNCTGLVDGGVIPAQITDIKNLFYGCGNLRRVRFEGKTFTNTQGWSYGVTDLELECHLDSDIYGTYDPPIGWTYKAIDGTPIHRILCFGDSLSESTYERTLADLCPINAMVNPLGNGGYRSDQIYQKMTNGTYDKLLKDGVVVIWHGTNGYGSDGFDGVTAKMVSALNGNQRFLLIPPTAQGAGGEVYESWVATYGAEHVLSMGDWFASHGHTVSSYQTDGTHFTADGYALVAQAIHEKIQHWL